MPAKAFYGRQRPYEADRRVKPLLPPPEGDSYPSGHAMDSYLTAILLAQMVPENAVRCLNGRQAMRKAG